MNTHLIKSHRKHYDNVYYSQQYKQTPHKFSLGEKVLFILYKVLPFGLALIGLFHFMGLF